MQYHVRALGADHLITHLTIDAADEADARHQVEARGMFPAAVMPARRPLLRRHHGAQGISLLLFSQELLALLQAGLSIVEGLEALLEKEGNAASRAVFMRLLQALRDGKRFSTALSEQPDLFPPLYIGIVRAAEGTSDLPRSLARYIDYQQRIDGVRGKIVSAAIYPVILFLVGAGVTFFLVGYVVPRFAEVYQGAGRSLPWLSRLLLEWGQFAAAHAQALLFAALAAMLAAAAAIHRFVARGGMAKLLARLPGIGERARIYELSRLYLTLGMLLEGGIPIAAALDTVEDVVSPGVRGGLRAAGDAIRSGAPLSNAFEANGLTTPISLRMLRVGERSGELGRMLTQSALFYDGELGRWIDRFTRSFEPLLMAAIGLVVGTIVVLLYMPIFDLAGSLS
ncbi:MAG TPA: type II secretion system F family protein [Paucimonas sp.]|nr:type II secretion system F family protein [Paucimonas sp.]